MGHSGYLKQEVCHKMPVRPSSVGEIEVATLGEQVY